MNAEQYIKTLCPFCDGSIEFPEHGVGEMIYCPHCGEKIELALPKPESKDTDTGATCGSFDVIETRHFITLTERGSNRIFRIPVSDAMVVRLAGPTWRTGDVVKLSEQEQSRLEDIDARCRDMGDEAAVRQNKLQNRYGTLSWIMVIAVVIALIGLHNMLGWLTWILIVAVVIAPVALPLIFFLIVSWTTKSGR